MKKKEDVFVTRDSILSDVIVYPATVGIRKFHGCIAWGAAWKESSDTTHLSARRNSRMAKFLSPCTCRKRYGFYPEAGTAYLVEYNAKGKIKKSEVDIDFSN